VRAVLDPNVLISALLSRKGAPAQVLLRWLAGEFELIVSRELLDELARALDYPKLRSRVPADDATAFVSLLRDAAQVATDPVQRPSRASDPADDYLLALAEAEQAVLVSGDKHLLTLAPELPVTSARAFLDTLDDRFGVA